MLLSAMDSSFRWNDENRLVQSVLNDAVASALFPLSFAPFATFADLCFSKRPFPTRGLGSSDLVTKMKRSEEHTSELQSLMRISYAVLCLKKKNTYKRIKPRYIHEH